MESLTKAGKLIRTHDTLILDETEEELLDRKKCLEGTQFFKDFYNKLKCTNCSADQSNIIEKGKLVLHPLLKVIYCKACFDYYTNGEFSLDEDGEDKYCRWCGEGGRLFLCTVCVCGFCAKCIRKNIGVDYLRSLYGNEDWNCFICSPKPIWPLRHTSYLAKKESESCKMKLKKKKSPQKVGNSPECDKKSNEKSGQCSLLKPATPRKDQPHLQVGVKRARKKLKMFRLLSKALLCSSERLLENSRNVNDDAALLKLKDNMHQLSNFIHRMEKSFRDDDTSVSNSNIVMEPEKEKKVVENGESIKETDEELIIQERLSHEEKLKETESQENGKSRVNSFPDKSETQESGECVVVKEVQIKEEGEVTEKMINPDTSIFQFKQVSIVKCASASKDEPENINGETPPKASPDIFHQNSEEKEVSIAPRNESTPEKVDLGSLTSDVTNERKAKDDVLALSSDSDTDDCHPIDIKTEVKIEPKVKEDMGKKDDEETKKVPKINETCLSPEDKEKNEIRRLLNLRSLDRWIGDNSSRSTNTTKPKTKHEKIKKTLQDMLLEFCCDSSGKENESEEELNETQNFLENEMSAIKSLVLGSESSEELSGTDVENEKSDPVKKTKNCTQDDVSSIKSLILGSESSDELTDSEDEESDEANKRTSLNSQKKRKIYTSDSFTSGDEITVVKRVKKPQKATSESSDSDIKEIYSTPKKKRIRRKLQSSSSESGSSGDDAIVKKRKMDSESDDCTVLSQRSHDSPRGRKNIRKLLKKDSLLMETRAAVKAEEVRKERVAARNKQFPNLLVGTSDQLVLDYDENGKVLLEVTPRLVRKMKPHQREGVKFMWDNCFESLKAMETSNGSGCILAHCMGLGKTMQVIALLHTVMTRKVGVDTALIICPMGTVSNWLQEFELWLHEAKCSFIRILDLNSCKRGKARKNKIKLWLQRGGVLIASYEMFRSIIKKSTVRSEPLVKPGPDLVICDEGHLLKNESSILSKCVRQLQTSRRIVLTGTPLQNNLREYYCMVQFIKPNILGTKKEFMNRFVNPIENGQFEDSTEYDVRLMKRRSHVLHNMLEGCIQRKDYTVLTPFLPEKQEYVLLIALSPIMSNLYKYYIDNFAQGRSAHLKRGSHLFSDFQSLQKLWTHPLAMKWHAETNNDKYKMEQDQNTRKNEEEPSVVCTNEGDPLPLRNETESKLLANPHAIQDPPLEAKKPGIWWKDMVDEAMFEDEKISSKLIVLFTILEDCISRDDKVLVFSPFLYSLDVIEHFLKLKKVAGVDWEMGQNYFRLDGSSCSDRRSAWCKQFNKESNRCPKLFLISTRAGGLGINLVGANRVILFDASWNPSHDLQSIFRVYRFGQKKPCYIYRLLAEATMEEKVYERQVTKLSLAGRVVDEHQIERHYTMGNLQELYSFQPTPKEKWQTPKVPKDDVLAKILKQHEDIIVNYHVHDSLLENKQEEELSEEERKRAWEEYENSQKVEPPPTFPDLPAYNKNVIGKMYPNLKEAKERILGAMPSIMGVNQYLNIAENTDLQPRAYANNRKTAKPPQLIANPRRNYPNHSNAMDDDIVILH